MQIKKALETLKRLVSLENEFIASDFKKLINSQIENKRPQSRPLTISYMKFLKSFKKVSSTIFFYKLSESG